MASVGGGVFLLHFRNGLTPIGIIERAREPATQCPQCLLQVPNDAELPFGQHLANLFRVNVEMDQALGLWREPGRVARDAVVIARTQRNDEVGMMHDPVGDVEPVHAKQAVVAWVRRGKSGLAWNRIDHRAWCNVQKFLQFTLGIGQYQAVTRNDDRPLRGLEMGDHLVQFGVQGFIQRFIRDG